MRTYLLLMGGERPQPLGKAEYSECPRVGETVDFPNAVKTHGTSLWRVDGVMHRAGGGTVLTLTPV